jgi:DNA-binding LacI/PurR family transcriptional regulator
MWRARSALVIKAVQQEARRDGYALFVAASDELAEDEGRWARALAPQVDIATGLLDRFADRGVRVPDDVSVVGFDDTALAEMVTPRLTTVRIPAAAAGAAAAQILINPHRGRRRDSTHS